VRRLAPAVDPDVVQPFRNLLDDDYAASGLQRWVETEDRGVAFFSPLKHGLLLGKYERPAEFGDGDFRSRIPEFANAAVLARLRRARAAIEDRFAGRPQPVLHAVTGALLTGCANACVLLGMRNPAQVEAGATVGEPLSEADAAWVRSLYRGDSPPPG
jgi:aryl-alcohol dehydrogenase-like predicted oxidoreductase